jgi:hypothetical protein
METGRERRRYFRITDDMGIYYRVLARDEAQELAKDRRDSSGGFDFVSNFDNRIQTLLESCKIQSPLAAELLDLINKKLNFVIQQMDVDSELMQKVAYTMREVNVSACGVAFPNQEALKPGELIQLDIMLYPSEVRISSVAKVSACEPLDLDEAIGDYRYFLRVNFVEINATDQEVLIQHVVKKQGSSLKFRADEDD